ncbi:MAG: NADPH-dependent F420 reductase [Bacteroidota bacterium]
MKIAFIGIGKVGFALADNLSKVGYEVVVASDDTQSESVQQALKSNVKLRQVSLIEGTTWAEIVFLAVPFKAVEGLVTSLNLQGKILVDCTNPVGPGMTHGLASQQSGTEMIQKLKPTSKVVKSFTIYGYENFINTVYPGYEGLKPAMLIAGDDEAAKQVISTLCVALGWEAIDTGSSSQALHLEHMTLLWIKMARVQGQGSDFVWARLRR